MLHDAGHGLLAPAADARFNGAVRFICRNKNVIGIVLAETREIDKEIVLVGHGECDF